MGTTLIDGKVVMKDQGAGVIINTTDCSAFQFWPGYTHRMESGMGLIAK